MWDISWTSRFDLTCPCLLRYCKIEIWDSNPTCQRNRIFSPSKQTNVLSKYFQINQTNSLVHPKSLILSRWIFDKGMIWENLGGNLRSSYFWANHHFKFWAKASSLFPNLKNLNSGINFLIFLEESFLKEITISYQRHTSRFRGSYNR